MLVFHVYYKIILIFYYMYVSLLLGFSIYFVTCGLKLEMIENKTQIFLIIESISNIDLLSPIVNTRIQRQLGYVYFMKEYFWLLIEYPCGYFRDLAFKNNNYVPR